MNSPKRKSLMNELGISPKTHRVEFDLFWKTVFQLWVGRRKITPSKIISLRFSYNGSIQASYKEIAQELSVSIATVRYNYKTGISILRREKQFFTKDVSVED